METSSYHDSFGFVRIGSADTDVRKLTWCYQHKRIARRLGASNGRDYVTVTWFEPSRFRTGMERIYCTISYGDLFTPYSYNIVEYSGGTGHDKYNSAFYGCLYKTGLELHKDGYLVTGHYHPIDVFPALIRCLFDIQDISHWTVEKLGI